MTTGFDGIQSKPTTRAPPLHEKGKEKVTFQIIDAILNFCIAPHVIRIQNHNLINGVASINLDGLVWRTSILEKHLMISWADIVEKKVRLKRVSTSHTCLVFFHNYFVFSRDIATVVFYQNNLGWFRRTTFWLK
ncbi:hypothetical protein ACJX0J_013555, partial [Zea mays]